MSNGVTWSNLSGAPTSVHFRPSHLIHLGLGEDVNSSAGSVFPASSLHNRLTELVTRCVQAACKRKGKVTVQGSWTCWNLAGLAICHPSMGDMHGKRFVLGCHKEVRIFVAVRESRRYCCRSSSTGGQGCCCSSCAAWSVFHCSNPTATHCMLWNVNNDIGTSLSLPEVVFISTHSEVPQVRDLDSGCQTVLQGLI